MTFRAAATTPSASARVRLQLPALPSRRPATLTALQKLILQRLAAGPATAAELAAHARVTRRAVDYAVTALRPAGGPWRVCVHRWKRRRSYGRWSAVWVAGDGPDARYPVPSRRHRTRLGTLRRHAGDPFYGLRARKAA